MADITANQKHVASDISKLDVEPDSDEELVSGPAHSVFNLAELAHVMNNVYAFCTSYSYYNLIQCKSYRASNAKDIATGSSLVGRYFNGLMTQMCINTFCTSGPGQKNGSRKPHKQEQKEKYVYF